MKAGRAGPGRVLEERSRTEEQGSERSNGQDPYATGRGKGNKTPRTRSGWAQGCHAAAEFSFARQTVQRMAAEGARKELGADEKVSASFGHAPKIVFIILHKKSWQWENAMLKTGMWWRPTERAPTLAHASMPSSNKSFHHRPTTNSIYGAF